MILGLEKKSTSRRILSKHHFVYHQSHKPTNDKPCEPWHGLLYEWHSRVLFLECMNLQATKCCELQVLTQLHGATSHTNIRTKTTVKWSCPLNGSV
jgi:hypothetical protein